MLIRHVEDSDGHVLYTDQSKSHRAVSEATAFLMSSMLADVINTGTAYRARQAGFTLPAAGKTGTTNDYVDAWFVGFTPHLVTGVWIGFDQPTTIIANGYAGELAVPVWASFMKTATKGNKPDWIARPSNVVGVNVCRVSGEAAERGLHERRGDEPRGHGGNAVDGLHRILRDGDAADVGVPAARVAVIHGSACRTVRRRPPGDPHRRGPGRTSAGPHWHEPALPPPIPRPHPKCVRRIRTRSRRPRRGRRSAGSGRGCSEGETRRTTQTRRTTPRRSQTDVGRLASLEGK